MSGRPKTEAEDLRQLIREAHEAIKDMRLAIKEIRAERAEHVDFLSKSLQVATGAGVERIGNETQSALDFWQDNVDHLLDHVAALIGAGNAKELAQEIINEAARSLASQLMIALDDHGRPCITPRELAQPGEVFVTTDPALAPPGSIILDAR